MHQSLHHVVADAPWSDEAVLQQVRDSVLPVSVAAKKCAILAGRVAPVLQLRRGRFDRGVRDVAVLSRRLVL
jgi:hypothetical protein